MDTDGKLTAVGFWRRVGAFAIDGVLIGVVGGVLGLVAFDALARLGEWARLIGLALAVAYFGVLGSRIGGGATLGQRLLKLRVAGMDGQLLPPGRALLRAVILVVPLVVNGVSLRSTSAGPVEIAFVLLAAIALFGVGLAQLYLLVFNRPSRRMVHDLLTQSAVVRVGAGLEIAPTAPIHIRVAAGLVVAVAIVIGGVNAFFFNQTRGLYAELKGPLATVEALPEVESATVVKSSTTVSTLRTGTHTTHALVVNARLKAWPGDPNAEARRIGIAALKAHTLGPDQRLVVVFRYGFDLGIGSSWRSFSATVTP